MRSPRSPSSSTRPKPPRRSSLWHRFGRLLRVYGQSMSPALKPGQLVLIRDGAYRFRDPRRGEIVGARPAAADGRAVVKRVTGVPLERVASGGREWALGPDEFFLSGDHAERSLDSRSFGPVTREELVGPVWARLWPWTRFESSS